MEKYRLGLFQNRELRIISGSKREKVTEEWRKLHENEDLHKLYFSSNIIKIIRWRMRLIGNVASTREISTENQSSKLERKCYLGGPTHRWVDNIEMNSKVRGWVGGCGLG